MMTLSLQKISDILQAEINQYAEIVSDIDAHSELTPDQFYDDMQRRVEIYIENVSTDTRTPTQNGLFFALKGEKFDAHHYLPQAIAQGCVAVVVDHFCENVTVPQLVVKDTKVALGELAKWLKAELNPITVAMTGSSGKTTVKEMTAAILSHTAKKSADEKNEVLFTAGNFNNDIGVPLTLLRLNEKHRFAVIELGANHIGEIAYTAGLVNPNVALINNIASAHLEGFGSLEGVAEAKGEIFSGVANNGVCLMSLKDQEQYADKFWHQHTVGAQIKTFSATDEQGDYYATDIQLSDSGSTFTLHCADNGKIDIHLPYLGLHNIHNAVAAAALALNAGAHLDDVKAGLEQKSAVKGRLFPIQPCENLLLLDDTYNANVDSLKSAISVLQGYQGVRILAVGDMAELGAYSADCHQQIAECAAQANLDLVVSFGVESECISAACGGKHFNDKEALSRYLIDFIDEKMKQEKNLVVLAKGSRRMKMEDVIENIKGKFEC